ncbi:MAG TPA: hypothetical protein VNE39_20330 [Planctomycetota bacterium]|nr:hypothetical protein [Planctomycetota bacterium]
MLRKPLSGVAVRVCGFLFVAGLAAQAAFGQGAETFYDGTFRLKPNGDMAATIKLTMPMLQYQNLHDNVSNLYLLLRNTASSRADTEVVEKKADWDDANRTVTFSMTTLGAAKNMGNHWEVLVTKGSIFTTFNEKESTFYFSEAAGTPTGNVRGTTKGILPERATNAKWDESRRVIVYTMPAPRTVISGPVMALFIPGLCVAGLGLVLLVGSFFAGSKPGAMPPGVWQAPPSAPAPPPPPPQLPGK